MTSTENVHQHEIHKFGSQAGRWWDPDGEFMTLHRVNPLRLQFIHAYAEVEGRRIVDVGCGGGILSEGLFRMGAEVSGIDLSEELLDIADLHGMESGTQVKYRKVSVEALADEQPASFDVVTCMEMLEHVTGWEGVFLHPQPPSKSLFIGYFGGGAYPADDPHRYS